MRWRSTLIGCALATLVAATAQSGELESPSLTPAEAIDHYLNARLQRVGVSPAPPADDANVLRRTMLDLVGRPPTASETREYLASSDADKRERLVERLLASPAFARQQAAELDAWLMDGTRASLREYLLQAVRENRPWDRMFREMIVGEPDDARQRGAIRYVAARAKDPDKLTSDASVQFFGVNVSCAKCHDHPLVADWKQDHYFGMLSFFGRTFEVGEFLGERDYGQVSFTTVEGESRTAQLMFLSGAVLPEPPAPEPDDDFKKQEKRRIDELKKAKEPPSRVAYSRRARLVEAALADREQAFFAKAIVNQLFYRFLGRGLVMPIDQMHSENPPSHPELLAWLARDIQAHGYDLQRLIRGLVLSEAYARTSRWDSAAERPAESLFAVALVRPLKPWQYALQLKLAVTDAEQFSADLSADELEQRLAALEAASRGWAANFPLPSHEFQVGVEEALLLSNGAKLTQELLAGGAGSLLERLEKLTDDDAAEAAVWNVFSRPPEEEEVAALRAYLAERADRPAAARRQMVWALLTSSEGRFNY